MTYGSVLFVGATPVLDGQVLELSESRRLDFVVRTESEVGLTVAGEVVPLEWRGEEWRVVRSWAESAATEHFVGDFPVELTAGGATLRATLRRIPERIDVEHYEYLLEALQARLGIDSIDDPLGRGRIWAALAPRVPDAGEERARVLLGLFHAAADAIRSVVAHPSRHLLRTRLWVDLGSGRRLPGRVDAKRVRRWDPPRPAGAPTAGTVAVVRPEESFDTSENRYVKAVYGRLESALSEVLLDERLFTETRLQVLHALSDLSDWFLRGEWEALPAGGLPMSSFVMRDHPGYRTIATLDNGLRDLNGLLVKFPPGANGRTFSLSPYSLNALYERWIQVSVFDWISVRLGAPREPFDRKGTWRWRVAQGEVLLRVDYPYPRSSTAGVVAPSGKNRPDVAVEIWSHGTVRVLSLDATYSKNVQLHSEKLSYGSTLVRAGVRNRLTESEPLVVRWAAVAYPAHRPAVTERAAELARCVLALPPSPAGLGLLRAFLEETIGAGLSVG